MEAADGEGPDDDDVRYEDGKLGSPSSFRKATVADDGLTLNPMRQAADEKKKKTGDSAATARRHWKTLQRSISSRSAVNASNEPGLERTSSAAGGISSSNKMYLLQAREVRKNFLMYSLALVAVIVVVLAGFGTLAAEDSQLQTVQYLGSMLLRSVATDLEWLMTYTEREVSAFAINAPPLAMEAANSTGASMAGMNTTDAQSLWAAETMAMIFALLDSAKRTGFRHTGNGGNDHDNATDAMTRSKKPLLLWQMYYARPDGTVLGVSQSNDPTSEASPSESWQCWGGTNGTHVRRTYASAQCGWNHLLDAQQQQNISTYYAYDFDARVRPWYTLAMDSPGSIIWTKPYRFKATGYFGLTAAVATRIGGGFRPPLSASSPSYDANDRGVFAVDITLTGLEAFMGKLAEEVQTKGGFSSFPADIAILYEDSAFVEVVSSSKDAQEKLLQLREKFKKDDKDINTEASVSKNTKAGRPVSVELCSNATTCSETINWLVFADTFRGFQSSQAKISLVALIRRSNFLAALELASRTFYPFIAAVLVMLTVMASNFVTKRILQRFTHHSKATDKAEMDFNDKFRIHSRCVSSTCQSVKRCLRSYSQRQRYYLLPLAVCIVIAAIVHSLLNFLGQIAVATILIVNKIALGTILHSIFLDAGFSIGFYRESWKSAYRLSLILICIWLVLISCEVVLSVPDAGTTKAISTTVLSMVRTAYESAMLVVYVTFVIHPKSGESLSTVEISRKRWRFRISIFLVLLLGTCFHMMAALRITTIGSLPHYTVPAISSVALLIGTAHFDRPVRTLWPRPRISDYTLVLSLSFLWILPWILEVFAAFTKGLNTNSQFEGLGSFSIGFTLSLSWSLVSLVISVFFQYFQETAVSDGLGVSIHFGTCLFRSLVGSLLFLVVEPLNIYFYILVLADTGVTVLLGLGLRATVWDRYCSKAAWKQNLDTSAKKVVRRAMFTQFGSIASMYAKAVMIVLVILDMIFVSLKGEGGGDDIVGTGNNSSETLASLYSTPALTGKMHRLERWAMLSGFVVQFSFNFMGNDLIERYISYRVTKLARILFATQVFRSGVLTRHSLGRKLSSRAESLRRKDSHSSSMFSLQVQQPQSSKDHAKQVLRKVTRETGGLGEEVLFLNAGGKKLDYSFKKHRDAVFKAKSSIFLVWSMYVTSELILRFYISRKIL